MAHTYLDSDTHEMLSDLFLNKEKKVLCHYYMECGKNAARLTDLKSQLIPVCEDHYEEAVKKVKKDSAIWENDQSSTTEIENIVLTDFLKETIDSSKNNSLELFKNTNKIHRILEQLEYESDKFLSSLTPGYIREFVTAFLILYFGTNDIQKSLNGLELVKYLTRYIVLLDRAYDTKNMDYKVKAESLFKRIMEKTGDSHLTGCINHSMAMLWTIAEYEIKLKDMMTMDGKIFEKNEICYHLLQKSSDTVVYATVFDNYIDNYTPNVLQLYHYNQALLDIQDDWKDLKEDISNRDLNVLVMACLKTKPISEIFNGNTSLKDIQDIARPVILSTVDYFETCVSELNLSKNFMFMKEYTKDYVSTLRTTIAQT